MKMLIEVPIRSFSKNIKKVLTAFIFLNEKTPQQQIKLYGFKNQVSVFVCEEN